MPRNRTAFLDECQAAKFFVTGDVVQKPTYRGYSFFPFSGTVIYSNPQTGIVQVQWPWGVEQEHAADLIKVPADVAEGVNTALDQWYSTWEGARLINDKETLKEDEKWMKKLSSKLAHRVATSYLIITRPLYSEICKNIYKGNSKMATFRAVSNEFSNDFSTDSIIAMIEDLYNQL